jgi:hypothetical protein
MFAPGTVNARLSLLDWLRMATWIGARRLKVIPEMYMVWRDGLNDVMNPVPGLVSGAAPLDIR